MSSGGSSSDPKGEHVGGGIWAKITRSKGPVQIGHGGRQTVVRDRADEGSPGGWAKAEVIAAVVGALAAVAGVVIVLL